jgi:hypothetical protein
MPLSDLEQIRNDHWSDGLQRRNVEAGIRLSMKVAKGADETTLTEVLA